MYKGWKNLHLQCNLLLTRKIFPTAQGNVPDRLGFVIMSTQWLKLCAKDLNFTGQKGFRKCSFTWPRMCRMSSLRNPSVRRVPRITATPVAILSKDCCTSGESSLGRVGWIFWSLFSMLSNRSAILSKHSAILWISRISFTSPLTSSSYQAEADWWCEGDSEEIEDEDEEEEEEGE